MKPLKQIQSLEQNQSYLDVEQKTNFYGSIFWIATI